MGKEVLNSRDTAEAKKMVKDIVGHGDPDVWRLVCKASSESEGWMKSTKAMPVATGVLVLVTTQQGDNVAEALAYAPGAQLVEVGEQNGKKLWEIR